MEYYYSMFDHKGYRRDGKKTRRWLPIGILILFLILGFLVFSQLFLSEIWLGGKEKDYVYVPAGADYEMVKKELFSKGMIVHERTFEFQAWLLRYKKNVKPGRFTVKKGMRIFQFVRLLRSGYQEPLHLIFNNIRTKEELASRISKQIEADSVSIMKRMEDSLFLSRFGVTPTDAMILFIPNTYEFFWNTSADQLIERMAKENKRFWNDQRQQKAAVTGLSRKDIYILASIIEKETNRDDEKAMIAGVYMNRLNDGWLLQADPTIVFALGDFTIRRVLNDYKKIDSPYNTYIYKGLPPGPICIPSIASIDAVLNYRSHDYYFFCAKPDMSGYHVFARTINQHSMNAILYQQALNRLNIKK
ncbi:MAG: endolytic transglycosylase MltG [Bacteroidetes bacterium]|nr:endolytic transglycosylase MltG [Bacteroidota bacterium]